MPQGVDNMRNNIFLPCDILIPDKADMSLWSIIACDQFSSEPGYWEEIASQVGKAPSTLHMMLPEVYLGQSKTEEEARRIGSAMLDYLSSGIFATIPDSYIYIERMLPGGLIRKGLLGTLDLEQYDYRPGSTSLIRATEGTVEDRLPPRVAVREQATLEMPHIIVFIDDADNSVIGNLSDQTEGHEKLYDFDLLGKGGHITGWRFSGVEASYIEESLQRLSCEKAIQKKYNGAGANPVIFAVGDGNHSLATAKLCWERLKRTLSDEEIKSHPARFSLVEVVNLHDDSVKFEPIHRVLFDTNANVFLAEAEEFIKSANLPGDERHMISCITGEGRESVFISGNTIGETIALCERFCQSYLEKYGGRIDYIHGDKTAEEMASKPGCAGILLPRMDKNELFPSIMRSGTFPRKSFSIGHATDKRYYLECRKIV